MKIEGKRHRGIYLLPNMLTTAALFSGFYSIVAAMNDRFEAAAVAIFVAMVLDGMDGRIARLTKTTSAFGAEYDSLADMISFGLAPSLVIYEWSLAGLGKVGWLAAFVFTAGAALRLARFNTQIGTADKSYFQGLASPAAAAIVAGMVWLGVDYGVDPERVAPLALLLTLGCGLLMVSNIRYYSFKELDFRGKVPFVTMLLVVFIFVLIMVHPPTILFGGFLLYALSGIVITVRLIRRRRRCTPTEPGGGEEQGEDSER